MFGGDGHRVQLDMRRFAPESQIELLVLGEGRKVLENTVKYRFDAEAEWRDAGLPVYAELENDFSGAFFGVNIVEDPSDPEADEGKPDPTLEARMEAAYKAARSILVSGLFADDVTLETGSLSAVHAAMQQCVHELRTH